MKDWEKTVRPEVKAYLEAEIFPQYELNDAGHRWEHLEYVLRRSLKFAEQASAQGELVNREMLIVTAAYHDVGHHIDAKQHEKVSAEMLRKDARLEKWFSAEEIETMAIGVEDHRSTLEREPRNVYGKIVATADKNTLMELPLKRTYAYRCYHSPEASLKEKIEESRKLLIKKYGECGYAVGTSYFEDPDFQAHLVELRKLTADPVEFRRRFCEVNGLKDEKVAQNKN